MTFGIVARAVIHFSTPLAPRINGAYYFVQVRSLLESGQLAVPDLPLIFWMQAAFAFVVQHISGIAQEQAIIFACKFVDCLGPVLLGVPVYFLLGRWRTTNSGIMIAAAVLTLAVVHPPLLSMTSQYEKNALGLVWFAAFGVCVRECLFVPSHGAVAAMLLFLALSGFTHVGVFGATLLFGILVATGGLVFLPTQRKWLLKLALAGICVAGIVLLVTSNWFDPQRASRLLNPVFTETALTVNVPAPAPSSVRPATDKAMLLQAVMFLAFGPLVMVHTMVIAALLIVWRQRRSLPHGECVFIAAAALTAFILAWPFSLSERATRLQMIAVAPLVLLAPFVLMHWRSRRAPRLAGAVMLAFTIASLPFTLSWKIEPAIPENSYAELKALSSHITNPSKTLIIARHGLEWWVVWTLRTKISHASAVRADDWQKYSLVAVLTQKRDRMQLPAHRGPSQRVFDELEIPPDAEILADGTTFNFARLLHPPPGVSQPKMPAN